MQESPAGSPDERREATKPSSPAASSRVTPEHGYRRGGPGLPEATFNESVRDAIRFLYNNNPFYVISAALIFWGLRSSFDTTGKTFETDAFMISLAGYTLLLAVAGCFLIRLGQVWDDVRTILLLVVLMLLALSVSFDEALAIDGLSEDDRALFTRCRRNARHCAGLRCLGPAPSTTTATVA